MKTIKKIILITALALINIRLQASDDHLTPMNRAYLPTILDKLNEGQNIIFTKYGDGEYYCMAGTNGQNCDGDTYHPWLGSALKHALISLSKKPNTYIGKWWISEAYEFCNALAKQNSVTIPWAWYHLFINDDEALEFDYMHKFAQFVIKTKRKKILLCNSMNSRLKDFFKIDTYIEIPAYNWSFEYNKWKNIIEKHVEKDCILLISGGLCSKVLIDDITNTHDVTFIDLGSSFDLLARKRNTRGWTHTYQEELAYYHDLVPQDWLTNNA